MPGKRINELPALSGAGSANDDSVLIFDTSTATTKRILRSQLAEGMVPDLPLQYYFGVRTNAPTLRINGDALQLGDYYLDSVSKYTTVYNGSGWNSYASIVAAQAAAEVARDAAQLAETNAETAQTIAVAAQVVSEAARIAAQLASANAEAARDVAYISANVYTNEATGRAAVSDGQQFQVVSTDGLSILRYRRDSVSASTLVAIYPSKAGVDALGVQDVLNGQEPVFSVVDADARRTWIESDITGKPTAHSLDKISEAGVPLFSNTIDSLNEVLFGITDSADRRTWLECNAQGRPTTRAAQLVADKLTELGIGPVPTTYKATYQSNTRKIVSGPDIVGWGDSMTAGAGGNGTTYLTTLQSLLSAAGSTATVRNSGVGGETSVTIAARTGATPFIVNVSGGQIPASGGVVITFRQINGQAVAPLLQGAGTPGGTFSGMLSGVHGTISQSGGVYTFTRTTPGVVIPASRPIPFRTDYSELRRGDIAIIWIGQNGPSNTRAIEDARAIVEHLAAVDKRYLVVSRPTSTDADDAAWFSIFGRRFVAIRAYLVEFGLADAGITPTAQDSIDMANGIIPTSLRVDAVHWTSTGYTIMGNVVFQRLQELGWV